MLSYFEIVKIAYYVIALILKIADTMRKRKGNTSAKRKSGRPHNR